MASPALKIESERSVERIVILENDIGHIKLDISEIKGDIREMRKDVQRLDDKIDGVDQRLSAKIDLVKDSVAELRVEMKDSFEKVHASIATAKIWAFGLYIALSAGLLVLARGFKWL